MKCTNNFKACAQPYCTLAGIAVTVAVVCCLGPVHITTEKFENAIIIDHFEVLTKVIELGVF